jgi:hypothetical protein
MTLKKRLEDELNRLAMLASAGGGVPPLDLDVDGGRLECSLTAIDQLACAFESLTFRTPRLDGASLDDLKNIAARLSRKLSYLLESISPIETDREGCVVQMRSAPPHRDDDGTSYYELVARRGELTLCRYTKSSGQERRLIPAQLTREVLYRLGQDLVAAVS